MSTGERDRQFTAPSSVSGRVEIEVVSCPHALLPGVDPLADSMEKTTDALVPHEAGRIHGREHTGVAADGF